MHAKVMAEHLLQAAPLLEPPANSLLHTPNNPHRPMSLPGCQVNWSISFYVGPLSWTCHLPQLSQMTQAMSSSSGGRSQDPSSCQLKKAHSSTNVTCQNIQCHFLLQPRLTMVWNLEVHAINTKKAIIAVVIFKSVLK